MSLVKLQPTSRAQVQRSSAEGERKEASFLTFNYVNKHARVRVSPTPLDLSLFQGKGDFLVVANSKGWFAAITSSDGQMHLSCSPLSHLHSAFATSPDAGIDEITFTPQRTLTISPATPNILTIACNDTRLLIGSTQGPIAMYDCFQLFTPGTNEIAPMHTFSGSTQCEQIAPNPGDIPELVAVLRQGDASINSIELLNLQTLQVVGGWISGGTPDTTPSSLSWSPKGKQIAVGLQSGDIITFSPTSMDSPKSVIPKPPAAGDCRVLGMTWLANPTFHTIYAPLGPITPKMPQNHYIINFDSKSNSASDVSLSAPYYPFPGIRPPGSFVLTLRNWDPVKFLLFVGDSTSSDIGSIGCFAESNREAWCNLTLDEAFTPSLPLDKNLDETTLLGLEVDLTSTDTYDHTAVSGEKVEVPPPPIVYAYCSDGTIIAWHVVNANGSPYPGMISSSASSSMTDAPMSMTPSTSSTAETKTSPASIFDSAQPVASAFSAFGQASKQSAFGQSGLGFGQSSQSPSTTFGSSQPTSSGFGAFSQTGGESKFGQSGFGQSSLGSSSFGQSAFGQPSQPSAFGQPLAFGQSSFGATPFAKPAPSFGSGGGGFASYASSTPTTFGHSNAAFTSGSTTPRSQVNTEAPELTREISMGIEATESDLGGLSLGTTQTTDSEKSTEKGTTGLFGQTSQPASAFNSSGFGSSSISPGYGAFSSWSQSRGSTSTSAAIPETKFSPSPGFGQSGFGTKQASPAFGQIGFGQAPALSKPSFGSTLAPASGSAPSVTSGGFGAYSTSFTSFASPSTPGSSTKPVWVTAKEESPAPNEPRKPVFSPQEPSPTSPPEKHALPSSKDASQARLVPESSLTLSGSDMKPSVFPSTSVSPSGRAPEETTPFKTSSPSATGYVFSNLKQSPTGFGAFGQPDQNSPFFKPDKPSVPNTPPATSITKTTPSVSPVFGSPSHLGTSPSAIFGSTSTPTRTSQTSQNTTPLATDRFSAFSGSSTPFGKLDGANSKPFSDLLKGAKAEEPTKQPISVFSLPTSDQHGDVEIVKKRETEEPAKVFSVFTTPPPKPSQSSQPSTPPDSEPRGESDDEEHREELSEDEISHKSSSDETDGEHVEDNFASDTGSESYVDESLSYEDINAHLAEEQEIEGPHELSPVTEETSLHDESSADENETSVQETLIKAESPDPLRIPLPPSRSPSAVPADFASQVSEVKLESPSLRPIHPVDVPVAPTPLASFPSSPVDTHQAQSANLPLSPPTFEQRNVQSPLPEVLEPSTTPPSSPTKLSPLLPTPSPTSPFGIGLGRPSARPVRSSPLAGAPILGQIGSDEDIISGSPSPSMLKPRPASPKPIFGQWGSPSTSATESSEGKNSPRSRTPPLSALISPLANAPTPSALNVPFTTTQAQSVSSSLSSASVQSTNVPAPIPPSAVLPQLESKTPLGTPTHGSLFSQKTPALATSPFTSPSFSKSPLFGNKMPQTPPSAVVVTPATSFPQEPSLQEGMQAECLYLFTSMNKDLEDLKALAEVVTHKRQNIVKAKATPGTKADLGDPNKWSIADVSTHGKIMKQLQADLSDTSDIRERFLKSLQEIESDMLKATTRKEEIIRFNKATSNAEFTKMLKLRTLGPEHLETQTKLRKKIRNIRDRVEKLEGNLQASKKTLSRQKSGKVGFKPPSLDTINRTYRNIDLAIAQQTDDVTKLTARVAKLDMKSFGKTSSRDKRLPDKTSRRFNVTPSVAATTAAALNAERSAYKLKQVLLSVRDKPLLNDKAAHTTPSRVDFKTPQKPDGWGSSTWQITSPSMPSTLDPPARDPESPLSSSGTRRGAGSKYHQKSAPLKKPASTPAELPASPTPAAPAQAATGFDWGPLPKLGFNTKPVATLPFSIR